MTEDDTFKALSRISFPELKKKYLELYTTTGSITFSKESKFFEDHKWTFQEYVSANLKRGPFRKKNV